MQMSICYKIYSSVHNNTKTTGKYGHDDDDDDLQGKTTAEPKTKRCYTGLNDEKKSHDDNFNFRESHALSLNTSSSRRDQELHFLSLPVLLILNYG